MSVTIPAWSVDDIDDVPVWVPHIRGVWICSESHDNGYVCTRPEGHTGRHAAGGNRRPNGLCPVLAVWGDDS